MWEKIERIHDWLKIFTSCSPNGYSGSDATSTRITKGLVWLCRVCQRFFADHRNSVLYWTGSFDVSLAGQIGFYCKWKMRTRISNRFFSVYFVYSFPHFINYLSNFILGIFISYNIKYLQYIWMVQNPLSNGLRPGHASFAYFFFFGSFGSFVSMWASSGFPEIIKIEILFWAWLFYCWMRVENWIKLRGEEWGS